MGEARKIAAILAADVVGYSRLAGVDEDRTLARLRSLRSDLIDPTFAVHNGRIVKRIGDGILAEFRSVVDAVRCAVELQTAMLDRNAGVPADRRIDFRIGIHLGDVVEEFDGDLMGDGVNIAARLEGVAEVGGVCLSEDAYRQVRSRLDVGVRDMGARQLKNIADPMRIYALDVAAPPKPAPAAPPTKSDRFRPTRALLIGLALLTIAIASAAAWRHFAARPGDVLSPASGDARPSAHLSIVVLPFTNFSNDPAQDYFADGVTENVTTDLARIRGAFVIARNTAFTFKGKPVDARAIGRELGVRYALEGSVQRDGALVRVNAQLIDTETGAHLWADRFESNIVDLFKLEDEVVARLVNRLGYELLKAEAEKATHAKNPDAVDLAMHGWAIASRATQAPIKADLVAALDLFERALAIDPDNATALAGEAAIYFVEASLGWGGPDVDYDTKILGLADRAISLAREDVRAYQIKSQYLSFTHRADEGLSVAEAGLAINPNDAQLLAARGFAEIVLGRFEAAKRDFEPALRLSPRDVAVAQWRLNLGFAEFALGHFDAAADAFRESINFGNRTFAPFAYLAAAHAMAGNADQAANALAAARGLNPKLSAKMLLSFPTLIPGLAEGLRKAGVPD